MSEKAIMRIFWLILIAVSVVWVHIEYSESENKKIGAAKNYMYQNFEEHEHYRIEKNKIDSLINNW